MSAAVVGRTFLDQLSTVSHDMLGMRLTGGKPTVKRDRTSGHMVTVSAALSGQVVGTVALGMDPTVAFHLVARLLNERPSQLGPQVTDAVGEVGNIIFGSARAKLAGVGYAEVNSSLPAVGYGRGQPLSFPGGCIPTQIPFASEQGSLSLVLALNATPGSPSPSDQTPTVSGNTVLHEAAAALLKVTRMLPVAIQATSGEETQGVMLAISDRELTLLVDPAIEQSQLTVRFHEPLPAGARFDLSVASSRLVANFREVIGQYRLVG